MVAGPEDQPQHLLRMLLANAPVGIVLTDRRGDCLYVNERWRELAGLTEDQAAGRGWTRAVHPDDRGRVLGAWTRAARAGRALELEYRLLSPGGKTTWVQANAVALPGRGGRGGEYLGAITDVTERTTAEEARRHLAAIVESSDDAIISETFDGILTSWNPGAERIYGYRADEVLGQPRSIIIPADRRDEFPDMLARLRRGERIEHFETVRLRKDGQRIDVSVSMAPLRDAAGRIVGAAGIGRDITERKRAEEERARLLAREQAARAEAEAALRARDEFLSVTAHELRTPLTTILAQAQLLLRRLEQGRELDPARTVESLGSVARQAENLSRLIDQLLDLARIEAGKLALARERTDLQGLVDAAAAGARARTRRHAVAVRTSPLVADVDPLRLEQVLNNLLDNAIKYSPDGGSIEVTLARPSEGLAEIAVRDHGIGIPPDKRGQIFERLYQAHGDGARSGMGLGLYVSRQIVELHGGELRAEFPPDGGSRFVVRLPAGGTGPPGAEPSDPRTAPARDVPRPS